MRETRPRALTIRLEPELYENTTALTALRGVSIKRFAEEAVRQRVADELSDTDVCRALDVVKRFRQEGGSAAG